MSPFVQSCEVNPGPKWILVERSWDASPVAVKFGNLRADLAENVLSSPEHLRLRIFCWCFGHVVHNWPLKLCFVVCIMLPWVRFVFLCLVISVCVFGFQVLELLVFR